MGPSSETVSLAQKPTAEGRDVALESNSHPPPIWTTVVLYSKFSVRYKSGVDLTGAFQHHEVTEQTKNPKSTDRYADVHVKDRILDAPPLC